jgi:hypothetical protein
VDYTLLTIFTAGIFSWMQWTLTSCLGVIDEFTACSLAWIFKQSRAITPYQAIYNANLRIGVLFELRYAIVNSDASQKHPCGEDETFSN